jgi:UDP-N-acetylmuramate dehydrogenase
MKNNIFEKLKIKLPDIKENVLLKNYTTYKIGGPAKYFFIAKTKDDLIKAAELAKKLRLPVFILGGGSNVLISEKGVNGLVIKINILDIKFQGDEAIIGAGANLTKLAYLSADRGLSGLEWSAGIPGTVGGAICGSAQAFGTKISQMVKTVESVNLKTLKFKNFTEKQCQFSLKNSIFKKNKDLVIVSATLEFKKGDISQIKNQIKEFLEYRRNKHPVEFPSAGSTFINPEINLDTKVFSKTSGGVEKITKLYKKYPELEGFIKKGVIPAGYLIAKSGLAGKKIGNAQISEKHSNFIINLGGAKADCVTSLINLAQKRVKKIFNINLEPEVQFVGF